MSDTETAPLADKASLRAPAPARDLRAAMGSDPGLARRRLLLASVLMLSACGISYELLIGAIASYLLGGSVTQFSLTIGVFLASMGVGAYLSRFVSDRLLEQFIAVEVAISLVGGFSGVLLFWAFSYTSAYHLVMFALIVSIGALIGLEIPLLTRYLEQFTPLRESLASVFSLDYLGSLFASILFPLVFLPELGIFKTSLVIGLVNIVIALGTLGAFWHHLARRRRAIIAALLIAAGLVATLVASRQLVSAMESKLYRDEIIYAAQSRYQRIVMTRYREDTRLYLNGSLQFSSRDEYRYHEALVHPVLSTAASREHVLVIGGGDGLALKQLLKYPDLGRVTLVDIDPAITQLARSHPLLKRLNEGSLDNARIRVLNQDAYGFLEKSSDLFSAVIIDLPDPQREGLAKLYSGAFYRLVRRHLSPGGAAVTQATSPLFARQAYWCIATTIESAGFSTLPYHAYVPSFGDWGFVLFSTRRISPEQIQPRVPTLYLHGPALQRIFAFSPDIARMKVEPNRLDKPVILRYYEQGWRNWF